MTRIQPLATATGKAQELLQMVEKKMGRMPNMMRTLAHSPAALEMYLQSSGALNGGLINGKDRERMALLAAKVNDCGYCAKAHTAIGKMVGLTESEIAASATARADNPKSEALLKFSASVIEKKGMLSDAELASARAAGISDGEIIETVAVPCLNIFTNYVNHVADPVVDF